MFQTTLPIWPGEIVAGQLDRVWQEPPHRFRRSLNKGESREMGNPISKAKYKYVKIILNRPGKISIQ